MQNPDATARVILIYGPDEGLMRERSKIIAQKLVPDLTDPFNIAYIKGESLGDEAGKLSDEAHAMSMIGGARVVFIENATEKSVPAIKAYLENLSDINLVIIQAGELGPKSNLRLLCEKDKQAVALPCYVEEGQDLSRTISNHLAQNGYQLDRDALAYLTQNLTGNRGQLFSELEKLITYMGDIKNISFEDAMANTGSLSEQNMDAFVNACIGGQAIEAEKLLLGLTSEGANAVALLRSLQRHLRRLLQVNLAIENGDNAEIALKKLHPPVFWKVKNSFMAQLRKWPADKILLALHKINELEMAVKKTETAEDLMLNRTIFGLAQMGTR